MMFKRIGCTRCGALAVVVSFGASCIPVVEPPAVTGPQGESDLAVTAGTETPSVVEGSPVTLEAMATGGTPPYVYRWDQNAGPSDVDLSETDVTSASLTIDALDEVGRYVFRVVVTDSDGFTESAFVAVEVEAGLSVAAEAESSEVFQGMTGVLTATTERGMPPITFAWEQESGPDDLDLTDVTTATLITPPFVVPGEYIFRVIASDTGGFESAAEVSVNVLPAVTVDVPEFAIAGEPTEITVTIETAAQGLTFLWEVATGSATFDDETAQNPMLTTEVDETVELMLTVTIPTEDGGSVAAGVELLVVSIVDERPQVLIETSLGEFTIELDRVATPLHAANFLFYVDTDFYADVLFHRIACTPDPESGECEPFVAQGGGYQRVDGELVRQEPTREPVPSEAAEGQTSLARFDVALALSGDPDSGTSQFFISLRDDNEFVSVEDFTVFGRVVDGTIVIDAMALVEVTENSTLPGEVSLPVEDVIILRMTRVLP